MQDLKVTYINLDMYLLKLGITAYIQNLVYSLFQLTGNFHMTYTYHPQNLHRCYEKINVPFLNCKTTLTNFLLVLYSICFPQTFLKKKIFGFLINGCRDPIKISIFISIGSRYSLFRKSNIFCSDAWGRKIEYKTNRKFVCVVLQ